MKGHELIVTVKLKNGEKITFTDDISVTAQEAYDAAAMAANTEYVLSVNEFWTMRPMSDIHLRQEEALGYVRVTGDASAYCVRNVPDELVQAAIRFFKYHSGG